MVPRKKGQKYEISYRCPNYEKTISERFDSYEAAKLRIAQIEYERSLGVFEPPQQTILAPKKDHYVTVGELLDEYVQLYGLKHWEIPTYPVVSISSRIISSRRSETFWSKT